mgnify:CR=1 FL=1
MTVLKQLFCLYVYIFIFVGSVRVFELSLVFGLIVGTVKLHAVAQKGSFFSAYYFFSPTPRSERQQACHIRISLAATYYFFCHWLHLPEFQVIRVKWSLHAREEIVFELLQHLRGNTARSLLEGIRKSTREMIEEQEAVRGRLFTIQDVMQSTIRAWLQVCSWLVH